MALGDIFTKVESQSDRYRVFNHMVAHKVSVSGQSEGGVDFTLSPANLRGSYIVGNIRSSSVLHPADYVSLKIQVGDENFFIRTRFSDIKEGQVVLDISEPLYKLQRREFYRVKLNGLENSSFEILGLNGQPINEVLPLVDLSGGGFAVDIICNSTYLSQLKKGAIVIGRLMIPDRLNEMICGEIRYETSVDQGKQLQQLRIGFQFKDVSQPQQQRLLQAVFDIHRELFSRFESFHSG